MASIVIQRKTNKNGVSYAVQYRDPQTGRKKHYKSYSKKREAEHARNELRILLDGGGLPEKRRKITPYLFSEVVSLLIADWKTKLSVEELRPKTYEEYAATARALEKVFGKMLLGELTNSKIEEYRHRTNFTL